MSSGVYSVLSGALVRMQQLDATVNNLANIGNIGFKGDRMSFEAVFDEYVQNQDGKGINFTRTSACRPDFSQGYLEKTDQPLDVAIRGKGFFKVAGKNGFFYTRQGNFNLDENGNLVTSGTGLQVVGENGPLNLPQSDVSIDKNGTVAADGAEIGRLTVYEIPQEENLIRMGDGLWKLKDGSEDVVSTGSDLLLGNLERSNVSAVLLTTQIIEAKRAYETYMNTIKLFGEISEKSSQIGKIG